MPKPRDSRTWKQHMRQREKERNAALSYDSSIRDNAAPHYDKYSRNNMNAYAFDFGDSSDVELDEKYGDEQTDAGDVVDGQSHWADLVQAR